MKIARIGSPSGYSGIGGAAGVSMTAINDQLELGETDRVMVTGGESGSSLPAPTQKKRAHQ